MRSGTGSTLEDRFRALARVNRMVSSSLVLDEVLPVIAAAACEVMSAPLASFWLMDDAQKRLVVRGFFPRERARSFPLAAVGLEQGGVGWVATHRRPLAAPDVFADARFVALEWWREQGLRSFYGAPVLLGDTLLAVLALNGVEPFEFDAADLEVLGSLTAQAAVAIGNARLFAESGRRLRTAEALVEVGRLRSQVLDVREVAQQIAASLRAVVDVRSAAVYRIEAESEALVALATSRAPDATIDWSPTLPPGTGTAGLAVRRREPVAVLDALTDPGIALTPDARARLERSDNRAVLAIPLIVQGLPIGALAVGDVAGHVFDDETVRVAQVFADQAALVLENARLSEQYRLLVQRNPAGIFRITRDGRVLECNDAMARILGYASREDILGRNATAFYVDPRDRQRIIARVESEGHVTGVELQWLRADGEPVTVLASVSGVHERTGSVLEGFVVDITDRKRAEQAEREAEALRSVTRLAVTAAHEINNPLSVILGRLELLARRLADDAAALAAIEKASFAGQRINEIIAHMNRMTRLAVIRMSPGLPELFDLKRSSDAPDGEE